MFRNVRNAPAFVKIHRSLISMIKRGGPQDGESSALGEPVAGGDGESREPKNFSVYLPKRIGYNMN